MCAGTRWTARCTPPSRLEAARAAEAVERLVASGLIEASGERLGTSNERIQEVAYARLLAPARRLWHQRVAESRAERGEPVTESSETDNCTASSSAISIVP